MERTCPHGVGHPDPDDAAYRASQGDTDCTHGCDWCCSPPQLAPEVLDVWESFWKRICANPDGSLNLEAIQKELFDFHTVMEEVSKVYDAVTGGKISKVNTKAEHVITAAEEHYHEYFYEPPYIG